MAMTAMVCSLKLDDDEDDDNDGNAYEDGEVLGQCGRLQTCCPTEVVAQNQASYDDDAPVVNDDEGDEDEDDNDCKD